MKKTIKTRKVTKPLPTKHDRAKARKKAARSPAKQVAAATVLVLRTCNADLTSHNGFKWPESGEVSASDFSAQVCCGYGLHGLKWGEGDGGLLCWDEKAKWLVVEVLADSLIELNGKVKFPSGRVVYCGDRESATQLIHAARPGVIVGLTAQGQTVATGYRGTATAGEGGTATAGEGGTLDLQWYDGRRYRRSVAYVGEDGIKPDTKYRLTATGAFEVCQ